MTMMIKPTAMVRFELILHPEVKAYIQNVAAERTLKAKKDVSEGDVVSAWAAERNKELRNALKEAGIVT